MKQERERWPCCHRLYPASTPEGTRKPRKFDDVEKLHAEGKTVSEIVQITGKSDLSIRAFLKRRGFALPRKVTKKNPKTVEKNNFIISLYKQGLTLESIGKQVGITRERCRQIIAANNVDAGGMEVRLLLKASTLHAKNEAKLAKKQARAFEKYGITLEKYEEISLRFGRASDTKSPFIKYIAQRSNANRRNIGFSISFADWWGIWEESGMWDQRGRGHGYVMARYGDTGPYTKENVYICTSAQNASDQYISGKVRKVNQRRADGKCKRGHLFDKVTVLKNGRTYRMCSECQRIRSKQSYDKQLLMKDKS